MKGEAYIYKTNGEIEHLEFDSMPPLERFQEAVGGHIETVPYWNRYKGRECVVFCNTDGKNEGLKRNDKANEEWWSVAPYMQKYDYLVGDIIVIMGDQAFMREL